MSDWVLATEESGYTRHFEAEALPVSFGADGCDLTLAGVRGSVQIGLLDDVFFAQPGRDSQNVRLNGSQLRSTMRLSDGDEIALDAARLNCRIAGQRLTVAISAQVTAGDTAPPDFDELARAKSAEVAIAPVSFQPQIGAQQQPRRYRPGTGTIAVAAAFSILAVLAWFAFTAKSVEFDVQPGVDELALPDTLFKFRLGERYLLRAGSHRLTASLEGYYPYDAAVRVGQSGDQTIAVELTKLPGLISFETDAGVPAEVRLNGQPLGTTPLTDIEIRPGTHQIEFSAPRHLSEVLELTVDGGHAKQAVVATLTPSWAPVTVTSEPPGADVLVDGVVQGQTPAALELTAGERQVELRLAGYNAWRERIMVVADQPQALASVELALADGRIDLASLPDDASVSVDGEYRGRTPLTLRLRPGRTHQLAVAKPGYETAIRELSVAADSGRALNIELVAEYGKVEVASEPAGAEVWVDGRQTGTTPAVLDLMAIDHTIEIRSDGYASEQRNIRPRPGFSQTLEFELTRLNQLTGSGYPTSVRTSLGQMLRLIPAGSFQMGSSRQQDGRRSNEVLREVELTQAFYLSEFEVTNAEFREFDPDHDSGEFAGVSLNDDDMPVVNVSWERAAEYLNYLSIKDGLQPVYVDTVNGMEAVRPLRNGYRLPTEAEWAWAARAADRDDEIVFPWGNDLRPPDDRVANLGDLSAADVLPTTLVTYNDGFPVASPVGSFGPNPVGIYDLGGNVAEWVQDYYEVPVAPDETLVDPLGPESGRFHVFRGPTWRSVGQTDLRMAYRNYSADEREDVGFRIARNLRSE